MTFSESDLVASITRASFYDFLQEFWETIIQEQPVWNWHMKYLCDELQTLAERVFIGEPKLYDEVINIPPGTSKSTICSQMFPAWCWTRMPSAKFICASYAHAISLKDSVRCRDIVQSEKYQRCFPNIQMREDENTKGLFTNTQTGFRYSAGIGGSVTGYHGHFLIVDDPINPEEAYSDADLKTANRWMETTLPSRKIDKKVTPLILIQQRLHQADPSGEALAKNKDGIRHICLPGELTDSVSPPELRAFYIDGLMDSVRLPQPILDGLRSELGAYGYSSQILQDPVPLGGGMFQTDKLNLVEECQRRVLFYCRSWDKAGTSGGGCYTVGVLMGRDDRGAYWILDVKRAQLGAHDREDLILETAEEDAVEMKRLTTPTFKPMLETILEIEGGSGGKESGENTVSNLAGHRVHSYHPTGDKEARAYSFASQVGGGNVFVVKRHWTPAFIEELRFFPHSKYKDQVDSSSGAFNRLAKPKTRAGALKC